MNNKKADIAQIQKYLQGELNARDQHELERAALDDPFLQDAIDGYAQSAGNQQANLTALDGLLDKRLNQAKVRRIVIWPYLAAATVVVALSIAYLLWPAGNQSQVQLTNAPKAKQPAQQSIVIDTAVTPALQVDKNAVAANRKLPELKTKRAELRQAPIVSMQKDEAVAESAPPAANPLAEVAPIQNQRVGINAKAAQPQASNPATTLAAMLKAADTAKLNEITLNGNGYSAKKKATQPTVPEQLLGKVEGVEVTTPDGRIRGVVLDETGHPLPGVSVRVKETQQAAQTDINGKFAIAANGSKTLNIGFVGYESRQVLANANDSVKIALSPSNASLNEVVVVGYGKKIKQDKNPHPRIGWDNYNRYLNGQAIAKGDIPEGTVKLSITVEADGALSKVIVTDGLNAAANQKAVDIVKNGSAWLPAANQKAKTITLKVRFKKQ